MIRVLIQAEAGRCDVKIYNERALQYLYPGIALDRTRILMASSLGRTPRTAIAWTAIWSLMNP